MIPCYNYGAFLRRAVESALAQTYPPAEVVVIDDASTDPYTQEALRNAPTWSTEVPIRVIRLGENRGLNAARNIGLHAARAAFIAILDADDWWYPQFLERSLRAAQEKGVGSVLTGWERRLPNGKLVTRYRPSRSPRVIGLDAAFRLREYSSSALLVRRDVALDVGCFEARAKHSADRLFFWRMVERAGCVVLPDTLSVYTVHQGSMSSGRMRDLATSLESSLTAIRLFFDREEGPSRPRGSQRLRAYAESRAYLHHATIAFRQQRLQEGLRYLHAAWKADPRVVLFHYPGRLWGALLAAVVTSTRRGATS